MGLLDGCAGRNYSRHCGVARRWGCITTRDDITKQIKHARHQEHQPNSHKTKATDTTTGNQTMAPMANSFRTSTPMNTDGQYNGTHLVTHTRNENPNPMLVPGSRFHAASQWAWSPCNWEIMLHSCGSNIFDADFIRSGTVRKCSSPSTTTSVLALPRKTQIPDRGSRRTPAISTCSRAGLAHLRGRPPSAWQWSQYANIRTSSNTISRAHGGGIIATHRQPHLVTPKA